MANPVLPTDFKVLRSVVPGKRPNKAATIRGMPFVNYSDKQFGFMSVDGDPDSLIAVRFFSDKAQYATNDVVVYSGNIYRANTAIVPGPWNAAQWDVVSGGPAGAATFVDLSDTPAVYAADSANKVVAVNSAGTAIEFTDSINAGSF